MPRASSSSTPPADVVVNLAAWADVDGAEAERGDTSGRVYALNASYPARLASLCAEFNKHLVHVSTDYVFGGAQAARPYTEADPTQPLCWYAETKLLGEQGVLDSGASACVARIEMPFSAQDYPKRDFARICQIRLESGEPIMGVTDQRITPVFLDDAVAGLRALAEARTTGVRSRRRRRLDDASADSRARSPCVSAATRTWSTKRPSRHLRRPARRAVPNTRGWTFHGSVSSLATRSCAPSRLSWMPGSPSYKLCQANDDRAARSLRAQEKLMDIHVVVALVGAAVAALLVRGRRSSDEPEPCRCPSASTTNLGPRAVDAAGQHVSRGGRDGINVPALKSLEPGWLLRPPTPTCCASP